MIKMNWSNERRNDKPHKYEDNQRRDKFIGGYTKQLNKKDKYSGSLKKVTWVGLGMFYASVLADTLPKEKEKRKEIMKGLYRLLLDQYLASDRVKLWTDEQRKKATEVAARP